MIATCPSCGARYRGTISRCPFDGASLCAEPNALAGQLLASRFEVHSAIGAGAIGVVFRGIDRSSAGAVAIKVLHQDLSSSASYRERFLREARAMMRVQHAAVVHIVAVSDADDQPPWLVMPLHEGVTLKTLLERGRLDWRRAARIVGELANGLSVAHGAGVIHRDLKPANVLMVGAAETEVRPVIFDFGMASVQGEPGLTETGEVLGTPLYMSPEQVRGEPACPAMDQYALGCLWFELLAGRPPFVGKASVVLDAHVSTPAPALGAFVAGVPAGHASLIAQLLDKSTERRAPAFALLCTGAFDEAR